MSNGRSDMAKSFDCVEMKNRGAEALQKRLAGMTLEQEVEFWRKRSEQFEREQRRIADKALDKGGQRAEKDNSDNRAGQAARNEGSKMDEELRKAIERAAAVLKSYGASEVYVFGSASAGKMREGSDVDLAVSGLPPAVFFRAMSRAADALGRELDLIDLDHENAFTRYLREEGELHRVA